MAHINFTDVVHGQGVDAFMRLARSRIADIDPRAARCVVYEGKIRKYPDSSPDKTMIYCASASHRGGA